MISDNLPDETPKFDPATQPISMRQETPLLSRTFEKYIEKKIIQIMPDVERTALETTKASLLADFKEAFEKSSPNTQTAAIKLLKKNTLRAFFEFVADVVHDLVLEDSHLTNGVEGKNNQLAWNVLIPTLGYARKNGFLDGEKGKRWWAAMRQLVRLAIYLDSHENVLRAFKTADEFLRWEEIYVKKEKIPTSRIMNFHAAVTANVKKLLHQTVDLGLKGNLINLGGPGGRELGGYDEKKDVFIAFEKEKSEYGVFIMKGEPFAINKTTERLFLMDRNTSLPRELYKNLDVIYEAMEKCRKDKRIEAEVRAANEIVAGDAFPGESPVGSIHKTIAEKGRENERIAAEVKAANQIVSADAPPGATLYETKIRTIYDALYKIRNHELPYIKGMGYYNPETECFISRRNKKTNTRLCMIDDVPYSFIEWSEENPTEKLLCGPEHKFSEDEINFFASARQKVEKLKEKIEKQEEQERARAERAEQIQRALEPVRRATRTVKTTVTKLTRIANGILIPVKETPERLTAQLPDIAAQPPEDDSTFKPFTLDGSRTAAIVDPSFKVFTLGARRADKEDGEEIIGLKPEGEVPNTLITELNAAAADNPAPFGPIEEETLAERLNCSGDLIAYDNARPNSEPGSPDPWAKRNARRLLIGGASAAAMMAVFIAPAADTIANFAAMPFAEEKIAMGAIAIGLTGLVIRKIKETNADEPAVQLPALDYIVLDQPGDKATAPKTSLLFLPSSPRPTKTPERLVTFPIHKLFGIAASIVTGICARNIMSYMCITSTVTAGMQYAVTGVASAFSISVGASVVPFVTAIAAGAVLGGIAGGLTELVATRILKGEWRREALSSGFKKGLLFGGIFAGIGELMSAPTAAPVVETPTQPAPPPPAPEAPVVETPTQPAPQPPSAPEAPVVETATRTAADTVAAAAQHPATLDSTYCLLSGDTQKAIDHARATGSLKQLLIAYKDASYELGKMGLRESANALLEQAKEMGGDSKWTVVKQILRDCRYYDRLFSLHR